MNDYTWPSVYFAYLFFAISLAVAVFFFIRSLKDGYWSKKGEQVKFQVFEDTDAYVGQVGNLRRVGNPPVDDCNGTDQQERLHVPH